MSANLAVDKVLLIFLLLLQLECQGFFRHVMINSIDVFNSYAIAESYCCCCFCRFLNKSAAETSACFLPSFCFGCWVVEHLCFFLQSLHRSRRFQPTLGQACGHISSCFSEIWPSFTNSCRSRDLGVFPTCPRWLAAVGKE